MSRDEMLLERSAIASRERMTDMDWMHEVIDDHPEEISEGTWASLGEELAKIIIHNGKFEVAKILQAVVADKVMEEVRYYKQAVMEDL